MITPPFEEDFVFSVEVVENKDKKGIPARVMLNHFQAISSHILSFEDKYELNKLTFFKNKLQRNPIYDKKRVKQLLFNSWNTEKLLRLNTSLDNEEYLKTALHWSFPQVYYSAYLNMFAFYGVKAINCKTHEAILKQFASMVKNNSYPDCMSFFADGEMKNFDFYNLKLENNERKNAFDVPCTQEQNAAQIATFLKTTREKKATAIREDRQAHIKTALTAPNGKVLTKFKAEHWKQITDKMGITTIFDLLYRQRIKANYQDIENLMYSHDDIFVFHQIISDLLAYLNFVHESYTAKVIGYADFENIVNDFPCPSNENNFIRQRFYEQIKPLFSGK